MSCIRLEERVSVARTWLIALLAFSVLLFAQRGEAADGIRFFKNYFVTGDYVAGFVDLLPQQPVNGRVSGVIPMSGVPANADILGAFLYWETITSNGLPTTISAKFRDTEIGNFAVMVGQSIPNPSTAPCWAKQGSADARVTTWRVDVLRSLPIGTNPAAPNYRKRLVNDADLAAQGEAPHQVFLPDAGTGNQFPESSGASLVVIYRHPDSPLTGIVLYEGFNFTASSATMSQTLQGFFQRLPGAVGKLTQQVSNGQPNPSEQVRFNGALQALTNPFNSSPSSQRGWRSLTLSGLSMSGTGSTDEFGEEVTTTVSHTDPTEECLAWSGFQFSVPVLDDDRDGLLNIWESEDVADLHDPDGTPLPNLYAMRARPTVQDIFVEVGFMTAGNNTRYGPLDSTDACIAPVCEIDLDGHSHLPLKESLDLVATAFRNAYSPRAGGISGPINIHFDVGNNYQSGLPSNNSCLNNATWVPSCAIIPWNSNAATNLARGGEAVPETSCAANPDCAFPDFPGTVGWKIDYRLIREQPLNFDNEVDCAQAGHLVCQRRFDYNRRYTHRYALFAHALGLPAGTTNDPETPYDDRVTPTRASGIADFPGGDLMVTLGRWDDFTGSMFMQASTLMHEFGHTAMLRHGGLAGQVNCRPNYQTVMNYLFQVRGLYTISGNTVSDPIVDYSRQTLDALNETSLSEPAGLGSMAYATRWFAPWGSSLIDTSLNTSPAKRHCDGTPLSTVVDPITLTSERIDAFATPPGPLAMARVDGTTMSGPIDWSADGAATATGVSQDISFSGSKTALDAGVNDWTLLDLRQVGGRRNVASLNAAGTGLGGALSLGVDTRDFMGGFDVEFLGGFDVDFLGGFDVEFLGGFDVEFLGGYDVEFLGGFDIEFLGDAGLGEQGLGDVVPDAPNAPHGDLNLETAIGFGNAPHIQQAQFFRQPNRVTLSVRRPHAAKTLAFEVYRVDGGLPVTPTAFAQRVFVGTFPASTTSAVTTINDTTITPNRIYTYFALAIQENPNNPVTTIRTGISPYRVVNTK